MKTLIINRQETVRLDRKLLKKISEYVADKFDSEKKVELNVVFVDKEEIRTLNKKYRNKNTDTDVLSFAYDNGIDNDSFVIGDQSLVAGEIIISPEVAEHNSKTQKRTDFDRWDTQREIVMLIIHGILHIYSFDHGENNERARMEGIQKTLLKDVFSQFDI